MTPRAAPLAVAALLALGACGSADAGRGAPEPTSPAPSPAALPAGTTAPPSSAPATSSTDSTRPSGSSGSPGSLASTSAPTPPTAPMPPTAPATAGEPASTTPYSVVAHQPAGLDQLPNRDVVAPIRVRVEGFGIDGLVVPVSADPGDGELAVPPSPDVVAWYQHGPAPGESGSAVLAAHVAWDGDRGPFFTLQSVTPGASVVVTLADDSEVVFRVTRIEQMAKADLPRDEMFARNGPARLTLVTCGGTFNPDRHRYDDNIIVFADLA